MACVQTLGRSIGWLTLVAVLFTAGCGGLGDGPAERSDPGLTEVRSALTSSISRLVVPAYFPSNSSSWSTLETGPAALPAGSVVIANPASGPAWDSTLYQHLSTLNSRGVIVLGYVSTRLDKIKDAPDNVWIWNTMYGGGAVGTYGPAVVKGIFFDDAQRRNDDDINRLRYLGELVQNSWLTWAVSPAYVMYNVSVPFLERNYVDCLIQVASQAGNASRAMFVSQENYEYRGGQPYYLGSSNVSNWADPSWSWVNQYRPDHFAHLLHDAVTSSQVTLDVVNKARTWNATYVYVTDGLFTGNTWGTLTNGTIWTDLLADTNQSFSDFGGSAAESYTSSCPASCPNDQPCWCTHDLCSTGEKLNSACSPCVATICEYNNYCCNGEWVADCADYVRFLCDSSYWCAAKLMVSPSVALFGNVTVNTVSPTLNFTMMNIGDSGIPFGVSITGANPNEFTVVSSTCPDHQNLLLGGSMCSVQVRFAPTSGGEKAATLTLGNPVAFEVPLSGTGI